MNTYILIFFLFLNSILYSQISDRIIYLNSSGVECKKDEDPSKKYIFTKVMDRTYISSTFSYSKEYQQWYQLSSYNEIRISYDSLEYYIKTVYRTCCNEPNYTDTKNEIKVRALKKDSIFHLQFYKQDKLIKEAFSKYQYLFLWEGKLTAYYDNGKIKSEKEFTNNVCISEKFWTKDGILIDKTYWDIELDVKPNFMNSEKSFSENLTKHIANEINYPKEALNAGLMGNVYLSFIITKKGNAECVKVIKGIAPLLDNESVRLIKTMPQLVPGEINKEAVNVRYLKTITFRRD